MTSPFYPDARPFTRWWWFSGPINRPDVSRQLEWAAKNGFGGVEIAWVYPLPGSPPGHRWLSEGWSADAAFAKREAERLGLGCDFTFGTLWPFGGSAVPERHASRTFRGLSDQRLRRSWEQPHSPPGRILDHLSRPALEDYAARTGAGLGAALEGRPSGLFCDSWEVSVDGLWTGGFGERFEERFGYDARPFMEDLDSHPAERYDYRNLLSDFVIGEFYKPYAEACRRLGGFSRVQCHGSPSDLLEAYAACDVPESEAILFDPDFSLFAASAAAMAGRNVVSSETFTCLYGWVPHPGTPPRIGEEQVADMKLLADALFANGVNMVVWHGMPFNPEGGSNRFYATVHVGPDSGFAADLPDFNSYMAKVCRAMRRGSPFFGSAAYLPIEDNRMRGRLPEKLRKPSAENYWELQAQKTPPSLAGRAPMWVSAPFLEAAETDGGRLVAGSAEAGFLLVDCEWLDERALAAILRLAGKGLSVCMPRKPKRPGTGDGRAYRKMLDRLRSLPCVKESVEAAAPGPPLVGGGDLPDFAARRDGDSLLIFFANPASRGLTYPMQYGASRRSAATRTQVTINAFGKSREVALAFDPHQPVMLRFDRGGGLQIEDVRYDPPEPRAPE